MAHLEADTLATDCRSPAARAATDSSNSSQGSQHKTDKKNVIGYDVVSKKLTRLKESEISGSSYLVQISGHEDSCIHRENQWSSGAFDRRTTN